MPLLNYLVTSKTRRILLNLLWRDGIKSSGNQLAGLAMLAYSSVHKELEAMKNEALVISHFEGRSELFSKNEAYPYKLLLENLLGIDKKPIPQSRPTDQEIQFNLARYGAPVIFDKESSKILNLEETIIYGLELARTNSTVARVIPIVLAKNKELNFARLEFLARQNKVLSVLGFYFELTGIFLKEKKFRVQARKIRDRRRKRIEFFMKSKKASKFERELIELNTPPIARKWNFLMNIGMESFQDIFFKHVPKGKPS